MITKITPPPPTYSNPSTTEADRSARSNSIIPGELPGLFCIGKVLYALPQRGLFRVVGGFSNAMHTAVALSSSGGGLAGSKFVPSYPPGASVLLYHSHRNDSPQIPQVMILGYANVEALLAYDPKGGGKRMRHKYDAVPRMLSSRSKTPAYRMDALLAQSLEPSMQLDYNNGKAGDASPGDFLVNNAFGGGLLVSDLMNVLKASESAKMEMFLLDSKIRMFSDNFVHAGLCHDIKILEAFGGSNKSEDIGFTPFDMIGLDPEIHLTERTDATPGDMRLFLAAADQPSSHRPLSRVSRMAGPIFDGMHDQVCLVGLTGDDTPRSAQKAAVAALSMRLDGVSRLMGAREASLLRTVRIPSFTECDFKEEVGEYKGVTVDDKGVELAVTDPRYSPPPLVLRQSPVEAVARAAKATVADPLHPAWGYVAATPGNISNSKDPDTSKYFGVGDITAPMPPLDTEKAKTLPLGTAFGSAFAAISDNADLNCRLLANLSTKWETLDAGGLIDGITALSSPPPSSGDTPRMKDILGGEGDFMVFMTLPPLEENQQAYGESGQVRTMSDPFPDFVQVEQKPAEKIVKEDGADKFKIYGNTCGVRCLEDGTVLISGGFGEEIKMHRGNITISCPGNVYVQPGKDFVAMAPRNAILKSADGFSEVTSGGVVNIAGGNDVNVCAGMTGNTGVLVLESKSECKFPESKNRWGGSGVWGGVSAQERYARLSTVDINDEYRVTEGSGGGVVIRSNTDAAILTKALLVDGLAHGSPPCLDICADVLMTHTHRFMNYLDGNGVLSVISKDGTACSLTSLGLALSAPWTSIMTNQLDIYGKKLNTAWVKRGDDGKLSHETVTLTTNPNPPVNISGAVTAQYVSDASQSKLVDELNDFFSKKREYWTEGGLDMSEELNMGRSTPLDLTEMASNRSCGAWSITSMFPCSKAYGTLGLVFPEALWQSALQKCMTWNEPQMRVHANMQPYSMAWPGFDAWGDARSYQYIKMEDGGWKSGLAPMRAGYVINEKTQ